MNALVDVGGACAGRSAPDPSDSLAMDDDRAYVLRRRNKDGVDEVSIRRDLHGCLCPKSRGVPFRVVWRAA
jgi:hypothetical protein